MARPIVRLRPGRARPFWHGNPLVFSGAVAEVVGAPQPADWVDVHDAEDRRIGSGWYHPGSLYRVRITRLAREEALPDAPEGVIAARVAAAAAMRGRLGLPSEATDVWRLINSEGDGLSGLTVDVLGRVAVASETALWTERYRPEIEAAIRTAVGDVEVVHRVPTALRREESMTPLPVPEPRDTIPLREAGITYLADPWRGQKTGFYCDQRDSRALVRTLAPNRRVLDLFCFTGGFSLSAAAGGASDVLGIDSSGPALALATAAAAKNGLAPRFEEADVRERLPHLGQWDLVICDPPKLAGGRSDLDAALQRYLYLNRDAITAVAPGGMLLTCSCSSAVRRDLFLEVLRDAATQAGRRLSLLSVRGAAPDHPVHPAFPEGEYLKCVLAGLD
jgi:23S rRNA G2069 N7-methylase RlmK/C1962 C5-methylase RlmI